MLVYYTWRFWVAVGLEGFVKIGLVVKVSGWSWRVERFYMYVKDLMLVVFVINWIRDDLIEGVEGY